MKQKHINPLQHQIFLTDLNLWYEEYQSRQKVAEHYGVNPRSERRWREQKRIPLKRDWGKIKNKLMKVRIEGKAFEKFKEAMEQLTKQYGGVKNLTQELGISKSTYYRWINGETKIWWALCVLFCEFEEEGNEIYEIVAYGTARNDDKSKGYTGFVEYENYFYFEGNITDLAGMLEDIINTELDFYGITSNISIGIAKVDYKVINEKIYTNIHEITGEVVGDIITEMVLQSKKGK